MPNAKPKLVLHIGTHKTGTTAIQSFLEANTAALADQGIEFPLFNVRWPQRIFPSRNGYFLNRATLRRLGEDTEAQDERQVARCMAEFAKRAEEASCPIVLLSDERMWFSGALHANYWQTMRDIATEAGFDEVEVLVYLRRQDLFAESLWNQFVKATKKTETLQEYLKSRRTLAICDYYAGVKRLESVFGKMGVRVAIYDRDRLKNGDAVDDFCYRMGLPIGGEYERPTHRPSVNDRLNNNLVEIKRIMNRSAEYQDLNNIYGAAFAHAGLADDWTERTDIASFEERAAFLAKFKQGNKQLAKEYFSGSAIFKPLKDEGVPLWEFDAEDMMRDAVLVMADMLATQEKHIRMLEMRLAQLESRLSERDRKANRGNQATSAQWHRERS